MKTINIRTDAVTTTVPALIPFQSAPYDNFADGEEVLVQLVDDDGKRVGQPQKSSVIKTHDAEENQSAWYDAYIPAING